MSRDVIIDKIKYHKEKLSELTSKLEQERIRLESYKETYSKKEKAFFSQCPSWIKEGKDWKGLHWRFNDTFNRDLDLVEFQKLVRRVDSDNARKLQMKVSFLRKNKKR